MFQGSLQLVPQHRAARVILTWPAHMKLYVGQQSKVAVSGTEVCVHSKNLLNVTVMESIFHGNIFPFEITCINTNDRWWRRFCSHRHGRKKLRAYNIIEGIDVILYANLSIFRVPLPCPVTATYESLIVRKSLTIENRSSAKPCLKHNAPWLQPHMLRNHAVVHALGVRDRRIFTCLLNIETRVCTPSIRHQSPRDIDSNEIRVLSIRHNIGTLSLCNNILPTRIWDPKD